MGQGTESCGGYDVDYDPYYEELNSNEPRWTTNRGGSVKASQMSSNHIRGAIRVCEKASATASFSCDTDKWDEWIDLFDQELEKRTNKPSIVAKVIENRFPPRGSKQQMKCHCGNVYSARKADLKRGWAKSCSKSCASIRREYGRPAAKKVSND